MNTDSQVQLLAAIAKAQSAYLAEANSAAVFNQLLSTLLELTESDYGFIGEIRTSEEGQPFLKTHAITNIASNRETFDFFNKYSSSLEFHNLNNLFGHVITSGAPVIANCPDQDPRRGDSPKVTRPSELFLGFHSISANSSSACSESPTGLAATMAL